MFRPPRTVAVIRAHDLPFAVHQRHEHPQAHRDQADDDVGGDGGADQRYYSPWGNLAIFYEDFDYSPGLVKLGRVDSDIEALADSSREVTVTVSRSTP